MSLAPLPGRPGAAPRLLNHGAPRRRPPSRSGIARRRWMVNASKYLLPLLAVALLSSIALWPEVVRIRDQRIAGRPGVSDTGQTQVTDARYRGTDEKGEPFTITATMARQVTADRVDLTLPKGDVTQQSGNWLMVQSERGVFMQHANLLDLSGKVVIYRDDGTTLHTEAATVDLTQGAAAGSEKIHAEGPFGTLDAQGFSLVDKGDVVQFTGPARLLLNGAGS